MQRRLNQFFLIILFLFTLIIFLSIWKWQLNEHLLFLKLPQYFVWGTPEIFLIKPHYFFLCKTQYLSFQNSDFGDISQHRNRKIILTFFFRVILPLSRMAYLHNGFDDISVNANLISIRFKSKRQRINTIIYCVNTLPLWFKSYSVFTYYRLCLSFPGPQARFSWIFLVY